MRRPVAGACLRAKSNGSAGGGAGERQPVGKTVGRMSTEHRGAKGVEQPTVERVVVLVLLGAE
jgi:hypothetical protein